MKALKFFFRHRVFFIFLFIWIILFFPFFQKGLLPIPADIIAGVYYPWLDYKWGYAVGVPVKNPLISDIPSILYPWRSLVVDQLKSFHWPLWNPYYFTGMPLLANFQSAAFSYVNIFFLFLPKAMAWSFGVMLSPLLTMIFMYLFLRNRKLEKVPSALGSIIFSLSGFEIAWLEYNVLGHTALFLPLFLLSIDKILRDKRKNWLFLLPIFIAFQIFSGYLPLVIYSYLICIFYILFFYLIPDLKSKVAVKLWFKKYLLVFVYWVLGISLSAVQLFPGVALAKDSVRLIDSTVIASNASSLPLANLVTFLAPDFFGNPATGNYFGHAFYDNFYLFVGTGTLILIFLSLFLLKKNKDIQFWLMMLVFSFALVIKSPIGLVLEKILFLSGGVTSRALFISDFSLAILAAFSLDKFLKFKQKEKTKVIVPIVIVGLFFVYSWFFSLRITSLVNRQISQRNLLIPFVFYLATCFVFVIDFFKEKILKNEKYVLGVSLILLISCQLLYSAKKYLPFSKSELLFPKTPVLDFLISQKKIENEPFRVELGEVIPQNFLMPYGLSTTSGYDALLPKRTGEFLSILETENILEKISRVWLIRNYNSPLFPLLNTKYILAKKIDKYGIFSPSGSPPPMFNDPRYKLVFEDKTVQIYEDNNYLPRSFWVYDYATIQNGNDFVSLAKSNINFHQKLVLEKEVNYQKPLLKPVVSSVVWKEFQENRIVLEAESSEDGFVFLSENYFPGWRAFVDNRETEILRADYTFRALLVPKGKHEIILVYRPKVFIISGIITIFSLTLLILLFLKEKLPLFKIKKRSYTD